MSEKKCVRCRRMHSESTAWCHRCKEKQRAYRQRKREELVNVPEGTEKKCIKCPRMHKDSTAWCPKCKEKARARGKRKREELAAQPEVPEGTEKKCTNCSRMHKESTKCCPRCKEKKRAYHKRKREELANVPEGTEKKCISCPRMHKDSTATCTRCLEKARARGKRKREVQPDVPDGHKYCTQCGRTQLLDQFVSKHPRSTKPTALCKTCRDIASHSEKNPNTKIGACREVWINWQKNNPCRCGETRSIHARGHSVLEHVCSGYTWWSNNGGPEALKEQLKDCYPLCKWCYRLLEPPKKYTGSRERMYDIVNAEKLRRGCCKNCKRKVTLDTVRAFDFDHRDPATKVDDITSMVKYSQEKFDLLYHKEVPKCDLLCCICHYIKTHIH